MSNKYTEHILINLTEEGKEKLTKASALEHLSLSSFVRQIALKKAEQILCKNEGNEDDKPRS